MNANLDGKLIALVRVRGRPGTRSDIEETLERLNLPKIHNLSFTIGNKSSIGMIRKCDAFITYGEIEKDIFKKILKKKGIEISDSDIEAILNGKKKIKEVLKLPIRLHPPSKGFRSTKKNIKDGGDLGYRGIDIINLLKRMGAL